MDNLPPLNMVDIAVLVLIGIGALRGYVKGLSAELARLIAIVTAFVLGVTYHDEFAAWVMQVSGLTGATANVLAYVATVSAAILVMLMIGGILKRVMQVVIAPSLDKLLGMLAGTAKTAVFASIILLALLLWPNASLQRHVGEASVFGSLLLRSLPSIKRAIKESVAEPPAADELPPDTIETPPAEPEREPVRHPQPRPSTRVERV